MRKYLMFFFMVMNFSLQATEINHLEDKSSAKPAVHEQSPKFKTPWDDLDPCLEMWGKASIYSYDMSVDVYVGGNQVAKILSPGEQIKEIFLLRKGELIFRKEEKGIQKLLYSKEGEIKEIPIDFKEIIQSHVLSNGSVIILGKTPKEPENRLFQIKDGNLIEIPTGLNITNVHLLVDESLIVSGSKIFNVPRIEWIKNDMNDTFSPKIRHSMTVQPTLRGSVIIFGPAAFQNTYRLLLITNNKVEEIQAEFMKINAMQQLLDGSFIVFGDHIQGPNKLVRIQNGKSTEIPFKLPVVRYIQAFLDGSAIVYGKENANSTDIQLLGLGKGNLPVGLNKLKKISDIDILWDGSVIVHGKNTQDVSIKMRIGRDNKIIEIDKDKYAFPIKTSQFSSAPKKSM